MDITYHQIMHMFRTEDMQKMDAELDIARDIVMGPREDRTPSQILYETHPRAKPIEKGMRCYGLGMQLQPFCSIGAPAAALRVEGGELDEFQQKQRTFLKVFKVIPSS